MTIGDKIYRLRKEKGLSQEELGYEIGVSRQTVSKWEIGKSVPETGNIIALSKFFNVDVSYFVTEEDNTNNTESDRDVEAADMDKDQLILAEIAKHRRILKRFKKFLICLSVTAFVFAGISLYTGVVAFSPQEQGDIVSVYFSEFNLNIFDVFLASIIAFAILMLVIIVFTIIIIKQNKKLRRIEDDQKK